MLPRLLPLAESSSNPSPAAAQLSVHTIYHLNTESASMRIFPLLLLFPRNRSCLPPVFAGEGASISPAFSTCPPSPAGSLLRTSERRVAE